MKYIYIIIAVAIFYYLIGAFIYSSLNSGAWPVNDKAVIAFFFGVTLAMIFGPMTMNDADKLK